MKKDTIASLTSATIPNQSIGNYIMIPRNYASEERVNQTRWDMPHIEFCTREVEINEHFVNLAMITQLYRE
jgi:hypothetical protein